ncbi:MAG: glycosyltransferase family 87 protein, partial [Halobacterium sp.]
AALAVLVVRTVERAGVDLPTTDRVLLAAAVLLVGPVGVNLVMGQVNPLLAAGIAAGTVLAEKGRERASGAAFGLVALVKLFPALVGVWLLRRRAWRAIAAATATGLAGLAAGVLVFGTGTTETYLTTTLTSEASVASFAAGADHTAPYSTVRRQLASSSLVSPQTGCSPRASPSSHPSTPA